MALAAILLVLVAPVGGPVARGFSVGANPFAGGQHRGVDLAAARGAVVRAPCGGEVVVAGRVGASGRVATLLCRGWRVTVMPLDAVLVRRGAVVRAGARVGTAGRSPAHAGLHLGVRRDGVRFGYADPLRFLAPARRVPPAGPPAAPRRRPPPVAAPAVRSIPAGTPVLGLAPWPAWAGLALVLAACGRQLRLGRRAASRRGDRSVAPFPSYRR